MAEQSQRSKAEHPYRHISTKTTWCVRDVVLGVTVVVVVMVVGGGVVLLLLSLCLAIHLCQH